MSVKVLKVIYLHSLMSICTVQIPVSARTMAMNIVAVYEQSEAVYHGLESHSSKLQG